MIYIKYLFNFFCPSRDITYTISIYLNLKFPVPKNADKTFRILMTLVTDNDQGKEK